jgi:hypothetical protein
MILPNNPLLQQYYASLCIQLNVQNSDSKLLSGFPWPINGNPDNNLESFCISIPWGHRVMLPHSVRCFHPLLIASWSRDSSVGIATGYRMDDRGVGVRAPVGARILSSPRRPDRLWGPPNLPSNGYRGSFLGGKATGA